MKDRMGRELSELKGVTGCLVTTGKGKKAKTEKAKIIQLHEETQEVTGTIGTVNRRVPAAQVQVTG